MGDPHQIEWEKWGKHLEGFKACLKATGGTLQTENDRFAVSGDYVRSSDSTGLEGKGTTTFIWSHEETAYYKRRCVISFEGDLKTVKMGVQQSETFIHLENTCWGTPRTPRTGPCSPSTENQNLEKFIKMVNHIAHSS